MRILRTCGVGESYADERLKLLRGMLKYHNLKHIYMLHDHKGNLCVIWEQMPKEEEKELVKSAWEFLSEYEIEHKLINFNVC